MREHRPASVDKVNGVSFDGRSVWLATGDRLLALAPDSGAIERSHALPCDAGTAFDGTHLYQLDGGVIHKIDPQSGAIVARLPSPAGTGSAGLTWAEGTLWIGHHRERQILQIDPGDGRVLRRIDSTRFVTGVTFVDGELWHATWEDDESELRRVDPDTGEVLEALELPAGVNVSGLESDGGELFYCGGGATGKLRVVRRR